MKSNIFHTNNLNLEGSGFIRNAVRAVISDNSKLLMIYSPINGDYKFPGGGVELSETHDRTLKREISEECGLKLHSINAIIGMITEYDKPKENDLDFFAMQSFYYSCSIENSNFQNQNLDQYEKELGFTPSWIDLDEAITVNEAILKSKDDFPRWVKRDTYFLKYLANNKDLIFK